MQKRAEEGSKRAVWLLAVMDAPYKTRHAIQIMVTFINGIFGIYQIRLLGNFLIHNFLERGTGFGLQMLCFVLATVTGVFLLR